MLAGRVRKVRFGRAACVVDEDVEPAERVDGELDRPADLVFPGDVSADEGGPASGRFDQVNRLEPAGLLEVVDNDGSLTLSERSCDRPTRAGGARSGDEGDLSLKLHARELPRERHGYARKPSSALATSLGSVLRL